MTDIILQSVADIYEYSIDEILSTKKVQPFPEARRVAAFLLYKQGFKTAEVAQKMRWEQRSTVSVAVGKMNYELHQDKALTKKYNLIIIKMKEHLKNEIRQVEKWLSENPNAESFLRYDKIRKLASLNEELNYLN